MKNKIAIVVCILLIIGSFYMVKDFNKSKDTSSSITKTTVTDSSNASSNSNNRQVLDSSSSPFNKNVVAAPVIDFKLKDLDGKDVSLKDLKGKRVFLNFWATWCPPCRAEMPEIEKIYEESKDSDLVIIAVNLGEDRETVKAFMDSNNYKFKVLLDSNKDVSSAYQISAIPTSFFIDKNGKIVNKNVGAMSYEAMKANIDALK